MAESGDDGGAPLLLIILDHVRVLPSHPAEPHLLRRGAAEERDGAAAALEGGVS